MYKVFHNNNNTSVLFLKVRTKELFFREYAVGNDEGCHFSVDYMLQEVTEESTSIVDSNSYVYQLRKKDVSDYYITQIPFKAEENKSYRLKITLTDNYRNDKNVSYVNVEKSRSFGQQYFNLTTLNGTPIFKNIIVDNGAFRLYHNSPSSDSLYVSYYQNNVSPAKPLIGSITDETRYKKSDSLFVINYTKNTALSFQYEGLYFIQFDTTSTEGISILKINSDFPKVYEPDGLVPPLSFITSDAEYKNLLNAPNPKRAVDDFWIKIAGNTAKARELIRLYYNRAYFSNYYFTNTSPGWSTDRGMVYIVYGPPHRLTKTPHSETWIYERKGADNLIEFTFEYSPGKFHLNNYRLRRSNSHTWHWTEAVYSWTSGDIFFYD